MSLQRPLSLFYVLFLFCVASEFGDPLHQPLSAFPSGPVRLGLGPRSPHRRARPTW